MLIGSSIGFPIALALLSGTAAMTALVVRDSLRGQGLMEWLRGQQADQAGLAAAVGRRHRAAGGQRLGHPDR